MNRKMMVTIAPVLGLVLLVGFHVLAASGAPKQNKHLSAKTVQEAAHKQNKHLADKTAVSAQGMALEGRIPAEAYALAGWGMMSTVIVGVLLAPWTRQQFDDIENMLRML